MTIALHTSGDFEAIADGIEPLTLHRHGTSDTVSIPAARAFTLRSIELTAQAGLAHEHDCVWQFAWSEANQLPTLGDTLTDASGNCWTILEIEQLAADTRLRVTARELRLAHALDALVDIEHAVWDDLGSGPEIVDWQTVLPGVAARIEPIETTVDHAADPPTSTTTYRVVFGEKIQLDHNHRLRDADGTVYSLEEFTPASGLATLPTATVVVDAS